MKKNPGPENTNAVKKAPVIGVGAVVIREDKVLLVKRGTAPFVGQWCIPGGKVAFGETLQQAAEREILEETSIVIRAGKPVYAFDIIDTSNTEHSFHYVVIDLDATYISGEPDARDDAMEAAWFSRHEIDRDDVQELTRNFLREWWGSE